MSRGRFAIYAVLVARQPAFQRLYAIIPRLSSLPGLDTQQVETYLKLQEPDFFTLNG